MEKPKSGQVGDMFIDPRNGETFIHTGSDWRLISKKTPHDAKTLERISVDSETQNGEEN